MNALTSQLDLDKERAAAAEAVLKYRKQMPTITHLEAFRNIEANAGKFVPPDGVTA